MGTYPFCWCWGASKIQYLLCDEYVNGVQNIKKKNVAMTLQKKKIQTNISMQIDNKIKMTCSWIHCMS